MNRLLAHKIFRASLYNKRLGVPMAGIGLACTGVFMDHFSKFDNGGTSLGGLFELALVPWYAVASTATGYVVGTFPLVGGSVIGGVALYKRYQARQ